MDAVARNGEVLIYAISEHIEFAGVHSGDATIQFPPQKLYVETMRRIKKVAGQIAQALNISGPFNIQFLAKNNDIKVIECNLRASRSFPFVSKVLKINFIELATKVMMGLPVEKPNKNEFDLDYVGIKASQFSFSRLQKADPVLGIWYPTESIAFNTASLVSSPIQPTSPVEAISTPNTGSAFCNREPQALEMLHNKQIDLVVNIPKNLTQKELDNGYKIRRAAIDFNIPLITNARLASAFIRPNFWFVYHRYSN